MPWTSDDAGDHTHHADTASKKKAWADTANAALKAGKSETPMPSRKPTPLF